MKKVFAANAENFNTLALEVFHFQFQYNQVYNSYCRLLKIDAGDVTNISQIPFLPISFFKTHSVVTGNFNPQAVFESSGTTQSITSRHFVNDISLYEKSFTKSFELFYGAPDDWCIIALLPSYLERNNSSLVLMAAKLIQQSQHPESGFYLHGRQQLQELLPLLEEKKQKTLLLGVTFALLDLAEVFRMPLQCTTIIETGGMKGRRKEMTRQGVHEILCAAFNKESIHSEYGMTELLSQAYSHGHGKFNTPPWMKILIREEDDPFVVSHHSADTVRGAINVIDLANIYSCSFIATEDAGKLNADGSFEVQGRLDNTDIRGCSLMAV